MLNRDVFVKDPTTSSIPNDGVTVVADPRTSQEWDVLRYELITFVCEGEYRVGLERVLATFLSNLDKPKQPAVWVSGFYGSGKSHFVRVLQHLWSDVTLPDGAQARGLTRVPPDIAAYLTELSTAGRREGGLWSAAGKLGGVTGSIRLDILKILFRSADLPLQVAPARLVIWLKQKHLYEAVKAGVEAEGANFADELNNMYVSMELAHSLLAAYPGMVASPEEMGERLMAQFPNKNDIDDDELLQTMDDVLRLHTTTPGKLPLTLLVFDELQQSIGEHADRALQVQAIVEACTSRFGSHILFVGTGQAALEATPQLSKLQARFTVRVSLEDRDVEQVVREVVLRKIPAREALLKNTLESVSGEISRHLAGSKIAASTADLPDLVPDYPLLPTRRRFWERVLRAIDRAGTAAQLRTQLRVVHEAAKLVAARPLGTVVGADIVYDQQKSAMLQSGVLLREVATTIEQQRDGSEAGDLRARLCALIFLIGELPKDGALASGVRATADTLADLLVEDLPAGSGDLRQRIPALLNELLEAGTAMDVGGQYRLQTRESAEWERDFRTRRSRILADDTRTAIDRTSAFRAAIQDALKGLRVVQGVTRTRRDYALHFADDSPPETSGAVPVWIRDEWTVSEKTVREDAQTQGVESPLICVLIPRQRADDLKTALAGAAAAKDTVDTRPSGQTTPEGVQARQAMLTRQQTEQNLVATLVSEIIGNARVFQGGGIEVMGGDLKGSLESALNAAVQRLFPRFGMADQAGWGTVVRNAGQGAADPLTALGFQGNPDQHPVCKEIRDYLGGGKKGREIRALFGGPGYGWSQDAIDGALLALVAGGYVRADKNGQALSARQIIQSQIGVLDLRNEEQVISAGQRIQVRKLIQDIGLAVKNGEEAEAIPRLLQRLLDLAADAGGPPPFPLPPAAGHLQDLLAAGGNDQFIAVYEQRQTLAENYRAWTEAKRLREERRPRWDRLQRLLAHAGTLPIAGNLRPQIEAVTQNRSLLSNPDPLKPLIENLAAALRLALQAARQNLVDVRERELRALEGTGEWNKLPDETWRGILQAHSLGPLDELAIGTDDLLLAALDEKPLPAWETEAVAVPTRMRQAREEAARLLEPKVVRVRPRSTTLRTMEDVETYLAELKADIVQHIEAGNPVLL